MERHVLRDYFPLDLCDMEVFQCHGMRIGVPDCSVLHPGRSLPLKFREGLTALSYVCFTVIFQHMLMQYTVSTHQGLSSDDIYYRGSDIEKVEFPSNQKLIPTHSVAFGSGLDDPLPNQRFVTRGPRFFNRLAQPFETISRPQAACLLTRHVFDGSSQSHQLVRNDSLSSDGSFRSVVGYYSYSYHDSERPRTDIPQER